MNPCLRCTSRLIRTSSSLITRPTFSAVSATSRPFSTNVRKGALLSSVASAMTRTTARTGKRSLLTPTFATVQCRWNSSAADAIPANSTVTETVPGLKIYNTQYDEAGKELTVEVTDKAVKQLNHIAAREKNPLQALRITVDSGGCHGYQYLLDLTNEINEDDVLFVKDDARVVIDTITLPMISGSRIDYIEELIGSAFKVLANPHAAHSCGCDTSFEIKI